MTFGIKTQVDLPIMVDIVHLKSMEGERESREFSVNPQIDLLGIANTDKNI